MEKIIAYRCKDCGAGPFMKPAMSCRKCHSTELEEIELSGHGKIHTFTVVHAAFGDLKEKAPYALSIVELEEGPKVLTIVEDIDVEKVKVDDRVQLKYHNKEEIPIFTGVGDV